MTEFSLLMKEMEDMTRPVLHVGGICEVGQLPLEKIKDKVIFKIEASVLVGEGGLGRHFFVESILMYKS